MFKPKTILEVKGAEDRIYRLEFDASAPLGEMHDALFTMKGVIAAQIQKQQEKDSEPQKDKESKNDEEKE